MTKTKIFLALTKVPSFVPHSLYFLLHGGTQLVWLNQELLALIPGFTQELPLFSSNFLVLNKNYF